MTFTDNAEQCLAKRKNNAPAFGDTLERIKRLVVVAMFSDDELMDRLVLKGGNAIDLVHELGTRASVDIDFSMSGDFPLDQHETYRERIENALRSTFRNAGYFAFDVRMTKQPVEVSPDMAQFWGGYLVEFKLIELKKHDSLMGSLEAIRRNALQLGRGTKFLIDISRFEWVNSKEAREFDGYLVFVYSPEMIVCEKLRAICQQMPEYARIVRRERAGGARARDFLDIHTLITRRNIDLASEQNKILLTAIFAAKRVPLELLGMIARYRDFHRADFVAVETTIKPNVTNEGFDYYFDFVIAAVARLKTLWDV